MCARTCVGLNRRQHILTTRKKKVKSVDPNAREVHESDIVRSALKKVAANKHKAFEEEFRRIEEAAVEDLKRCKVEATQMLIRTLTPPTQ